jgi:hypothetical protein
VGGGGASKKPLHMDRGQNRCRTSDVGRRWGDGSSDLGLLKGTLKSLLTWIGDRTRCRTSDVGRRWGDCSPDLGLLKGDSEEPLHMDRDRWGPDTVIRMAGNYVAGRKIVSFALPRAKKRSSRVTVHSLTHMKENPFAPSGPTGAERGRQRGGASEVPGPFTSIGRIHRIFKRSTQLHYWFRTKSHPSAWFASKCPVPFTDVRRLTSDNRPKKVLGLRVNVRRYPAGVAAPPGN